MKNYHAILIVLMLTGCGTQLTPEEMACGWAPATTESVTAPAGDCLLVRSEGETRLIPVGASACEGQADVTCLVLRPGESTAFAHPLGNDGDGVVRVKPELANKNGTCRAKCE
jgi:hypothetical protein